MRTNPVHVTRELFIDRARHPEALDPQRVADLWSVEALPRSAAYDPGWWYRWGMGPNVLWLTESLAQLLDLRPGMRVLDLGCGSALSSIFLAREFGCRVTAADLWIDPSDNWARIVEAEVTDLVTPVSVEAHDLPFAAGFFDAVVSIDAYHYFGTDELYLAELAAYVRPGGRIGVVVPGHVDDEADHLLSFRSAAWWSRLWSRTEGITVEHADVVPDGRALWRRTLDVQEAWGGADWLALHDRELVESDVGAGLCFPRLVASVGIVEPPPVRQVLPAVLDLLRHLEAVGFEGSSRVVDGEVAWVDGLPSPHPHAWADDQVVAVGRLLRELHDATATYEPPPDAVWPEWSSRRDDADTFGHGDLGPWNVVVRDGVPVAFVDWEYAGPVDRLDEVAEAAWLNCQLHDDDVAERVGLPPAEVRARQLRLFADAYGLTAEERVGFIERMIAVAVRQAASEAERRGATRDSNDPGPMWTLVWRIRGAAWMQRNRSLLEAALAG